MSLLLVLSTVLITLALVFYSLGIWAERFAHFLKPWHVVMFCLGLLFDASGTYSMHLLSEGSAHTSFIHTLTGQLALWLMFIHAAWALIVVWKGSDKSKTTFHRYSLIVWCIWLVPYLIGVWLGMSK